MTRFGPIRVRTMGNFWGQSRKRFIGILEVQDGHYQGTHHRTTLTEREKLCLKCTLPECYEGAEGCRYSHWADVECEKFVHSIKASIKWAVGVILDD